MPVQRNNLSTPPNVTFVTQLFLPFQSIYVRLLSTNKVDDIGIEISADMVKIELKRNPKQ